MKRKIVFRGKSIKEGKWYFGMPVEICGGSIAIIYNDCEIISDDLNTDNYKLVAPETVGQFTGLTDKNGKEIYEGDIVKKTCIYGYVGMFYTGEVVFKDGSFVIDTHDKYESLRYTNFDYKCEWSDGHCHGVDEYEFEVIGNIYDNPDLIKKK